MTSSPDLLENMTREWQSGFATGLASGIAQVLAALIREEPTTAGAVRGFARAQANNGIRQLPGVIERELEMRNVPFEPPLKTPRVKPSRPDPVARSPTTSTEDPTQEGLFNESSTAKRKTTET